MRKFIYTVKWSAFNHETRWHLYVQANKRFSMREIFAKQHYVLTHILELPFNEFELKIASCREDRIRAIYSLEPIDTSAFHFDIIKVNKLQDIIELDYDFVLEFVFMKERHIKPFLNFLQTHWKGEWIKNEIFEKKKNDKKGELKK